MRVECHFASVVRIDGFTLPTSTSQLTLFERPHLRAILGIQIDELCADLDVSRALAVLLLHGVMAAERSEFDVAVAAEVKRIVERRHKEGKNRVLLFIESTVPMDVDPNSPHREEHGIVVGFDLVDRDAAARVHREATRGIVAALSLASEQDITTHKLSEGCIVGTPGESCICPTPPLWAKQRSSFRAHRRRLRLSPTTSTN